MCVSTEFTELLYSSTAMVPKKSRSQGRESATGHFLRTVSQTLVSVELLTDMRSSRMRRQSKRVLLKASITSVILLSVAFIVTYSIILTYISNRVPIMRHQDDSSAEKYKSGKRTKLHHKSVEVFGKKHVIQFIEDTVIKWHIQELYDIFSVQPNCQQGSKFLIVITSAPENSDRRKAIRETWCNPSRFNLTKFAWQCLFLVGQSTHRPSEVLVDNEMNNFNDILKGSYIDSYRNLTQKVIHGLHWASTICPTDYVLKTDDDVFVNAKLLSNILDADTPVENVYIGLVVDTPERLEVIRNPINKWVVTFEEYPESHYPPYSSGMGYVLSSDVVSRMVNLSEYVTPIPNEDAYIGVLANRLGVEPVKTGRFTLTGSGLRLCNYMYLVIIHHITPQEQYSNFRKALDAPSQCDKKNDVALGWT